MAALEGSVEAKKCSVLFFWAQWHEPSAPGGQMDVVFNSLAETYPGLDFTKVEAEEDPSLSAQHGIEVVPSFVFLFADGKQAFKVEGVNPPEVAKCAAALAQGATSAGGGGSTSSASATSNSLDVRLKQLINTSTMMVMIKGTVEQPKCKFSRELVEMLKEDQIQFGAFDILSDEEVRQGLKKFSDWPTYPQVYVKGELVGGLDIVKEMREGGNLKKELGLVGDDAALPPPAATATALPIEDRLKALIGSKKVMLFMKGNPEAPQCGFSRKVVGILEDEGFEGFGHFDILSDEDVRQGLKAYSNWPTYPQLYVDSELIGGLDIIEELQASGELSALK